MRTQAVLDRLLQALDANCGDMLLSARAIGCSLQWVEQWRSDDPEVDKVLKEAEKLGNNGLVSAAIKRAVHGVEEPVFNRGTIVGYVTKYSDGLLTTLLKARVEEFRPASENTPQVTVNIANLMPRANSYEEWLAMRDMTVQPKLTDMSDFAKAVMAPPDEEVIDSSFKVLTSIRTLADVEL